MLLVLEMPAYCFDNRQPISDVCRDWVEANCRCLTSKAVGAGLTYVPPQGMVRSLAMDDIFSQLRSMIAGFESRSSLGSSRSTLARSFFVTTFVSAHHCRPTGHSLAWPHAAPYRQSLCATDSRSPLNPTRLITLREIPNMNTRPPSSQRTSKSILLVRRYLPLALALVTGHAIAVGDTTIIKADPIEPSDDSQPALSADGRFVAFRAVTNRQGPALNAGIYLLDRHRLETVRIADMLSDPQHFPPQNPALSANGRFVAFHTRASNLVPGDTNDQDDVFVYDRLTRKITRDSVDSNGNQGTRNSVFPALSADGRFVAFLSSADNLVPGDTNGADDVFVHDRLTEKTTRISVDSTGTQGNAGTDFGRIGISADGRYIAFTSYASNLVPGDTNARRDVFVHDRRSGQTTRVSVDSAGNQGYGPEALYPEERDVSISADGRCVAYTSRAATLVPDDTNRVADILVHDRVSRQTTRVSLASDGSQATFDSRAPVLSSDGRFVVFVSGDPALDTEVSGPPRLEVYRHDRQTGTTQVVSVDSLGTRLGTEWFQPPPALSADGRQVAFASGSYPTNIYVRDALLDRSATADLAVTQTVSPNAFEPLAPVTYTVTAVNHGPDAADEVSLYDTPALRSATVSSAKPSQGHCSQGAPLVCYFGALAPGAEATLTLTLQPKWRGTPRLSNTARISAAPVDPLSRNNATTLRVDGAP